MSLYKSLTERQADQAKARQKAADLARKLATKSSRHAKNTSPVAVIVPPPSDAPIAAPPAHVAEDQRPWIRTRIDSGHLQMFARASGEKVGLQPWTYQLVNALLEGAETGAVTLFLAWPAKLTGLPLLHAIAGIERVFAKDLRGLRTMLYPGTHASRSSLQTVVADRKALSDLYRSMWSAGVGGKMELASATQSDSFAAVLQALNDVRNYNSDLPNPSLAELFPVFVYDPAGRAWSTTASAPLERTLSKVERLANRREVREKVSAEWSNPEKAPGALMVLHHSAKKEGWRRALDAQCIKGRCRPEALLLDATHAAALTNYSAVRRIPEFLALARESSLAGCGAVIVTDDPKAFFALRAQLHETRIAFSTHVCAAEADEPIVSTAALAREWRPNLRSNANFSVSIVDRDASQVALAFQKLAGDAGTDESVGNQALMQACMYLLRLSNMPAGYLDLTAASVEAGETDYSSQQHAWTPVQLRITEALAAGALNGIRDQVAKTVARAEKLIDAWSDCTPMAARMLAEVRKHAIASRAGVSLVLPNSRYVLLAQSFLQRTLGPEWELAKDFLEWHTLSAVGRTLTGDLRGRHFVFVGVNADVVRTLLTHPAVPNGTAVLIAYRQADSTLKTLLLMKELDAFKPYRGRIGLLIQEIQRRLAEVPNPVVIERLREVPMTFKFEESAQGGVGDQSYYKFELEGGGRAYASGWVYRFVPDEDPPFRRAAASSVRPGEFIFDMSDDLRTKLEATLNLRAAGASSVVDPVRMLLKLYHTDVATRCSLMFTSTKRSALAREIHSKMVEVDPAAKECRPGRVYYWLDLQADGDTRPHAAKDSKFFKVFCKALGMEEQAADQHWHIVRNARRLNQSLGRELVARYAEILFHPESAMTYRKVPEATIRLLQQEALSCVFRVEAVIFPPHRPLPQSQKKVTTYAGAK